MCLSIYLVFNQFIIQISNCVSGFHLLFFICLSGFLSVCLVFYRGLLFSFSLSGFLSFYLVWFGLSGILISISLSDFLSVGLVYFQFIWFSIKLSSLLTGWLGVFLFIWFLSDDLVLYLFIWVYVYPFIWFSTCLSVFQGVFESLVFVCLIIFCFFARSSFSS